MASRNRQLTVLINREPYYAASKAQEILGMTYSALRNQVDAGNIEAKIPKGRRQAHYKAKDVDQLARELGAFMLHRKTKPTEFTEATKEEIPEIARISRAIFDPPNSPPEEYKIYVETRSKWLERHPYTMYVLKSENTVIGYASIAALSPEKIDEIIHSQISSDDIRAEDIKDINSEEPIHLYIIAVGVDPRHNINEKHFYGSRLVSGLITLLTQLGEKGVKIETITARSHKPDGIRLLRKMGIPELPTPVPGKRLFKLEVKDTGNPLFTRYKEALREQKEKEEDRNSNTNRALVQ